MKSSGVVKSTCYCGVTEYALPILIDGQLTCLVSATGFFGEIGESSEQILSRVLEMDLEALRELRRSTLSSVHDEAVTIRAIEILGRLLERFLLEHTDIAHRIAALHPESNNHVQNATNYISSHFAEAIDVDAVAGYCHVNNSYLQHLFSKILGHGIAEEIRIRRLSYARELLCTTDCSVKYISYLAGFFSSDYFSTAFKKHFGVSLLAYRKKHAYVR